MLVNTGLYLGPLVVLLVFAACLLAVSIVAVIRGQRRKVSAGAETLVGQTAVTRTPLTPEGTVLVDGELWHAISSGPHVDVGRKVLVTAVEGLTLKVGTKEDKDV
jgi:membrane-bound serine protease (ClpP class)